MAFLKIFSPRFSLVKCHSLNFKHLLHICGITLIHPSGMNITVIASRSLFLHLHQPSSELTPLSCTPIVFCIIFIVLSHIWLGATPWTIACQVPLSMEFSRQEIWSGLPFPSPEDLPNAGIEFTFPALQADSLLSEPPGNPFIISIKPDI